MLLTEWNMETALEVRYDEGRTEGREEIFSLLEKGLSLTEIKEKLGYSKFQ